MPSKSRRKGKEAVSESAPPANDKVKKKAKGAEAAEPPNGSGRLIAIEGTRGLDLTEAAAEVVKRLEKSKIAAGASRWDASNTFY